MTNSEKEKVINKLNVIFANIGNNAQELQNVIYAGWTEDYKPTCADLVETEVRKMLDERIETGDEYELGKFVGYIDRIFDMTEE